MFVSTHAKEHEGTRAGRANPKTQMDKQNLYPNSIRAVPGELQPVSQWERLLSITLQTEGPCCLWDSLDDAQEECLWLVQDLFMGYLGKEPKVGKMNGSVWFGRSKFGKIEK